MKISGGLENRKTENENGNCNGRRRVWFGIEIEIDIEIGVGFVDFVLLTFLLMKNKKKMYLRYVQMKIFL